MMDMVTGLDLIRKRQLRHGSTIAAQSANSDVLAQNSTFTRKFTIRPVRKLGTAYWSFLTSVTQ